MSHHRHPSPVRPLAAQRILLLHTSPAGRRRVRSWLEATGCQVVEVSDGTTALRLLLDRRVDVDAVLGDGDCFGAELVAALDACDAAPPLIDLRESEPRSVDQLLERVGVALERTRRPRRRVKAARRRAGALVAEGDRIHIGRAETTPEARGLGDRLRGAARRGCPVCGSDRVAAFVYGSPSHEVLQQYLAGRVVLGGVTEAAGSPRWYCRDCERRWRDPD